MTRVQTQGRYSHRCNHPGCKKTIREGTSNWPTGLCMEHQPKPMPQPVDMRKRPVIVHRIPGCSTLPSASVVNVPKEPWLP